MLRTIIELGLLRLKEISATEKRFAEQQGVGNSAGKEAWFKSPPKSITEYQKGWMNNPTLIAFSIAQEPPGFKEPKKKKGDRGRGKSLFLILKEFLNINLTSIGAIYFEERGIQKVKNLV